MATMPSVEERLDHECQMTRLELWCLTQWLGQHPEESAAFVLRERTNIFLRSDLYDGRPFRQVDWTDPRWLELEEGLCRLLEECLGRSETADFEERGLAIFRPTDRAACGPGRRAASEAAILARGPRVRQPVVHASRGRPGGG